MAATPRDGWTNRLAQRDPQLHIHLIGIGGAGLGPIAQVLLEQGMRVSGSDRQANATTAQLGRRRGDHLPAADRRQFAGPARGGPRPDVVLISSAVAADNPERQAAEQLGLPVVKRSEFLPALLAERRVIAVAGTHGKSTTTAMLVHILHTAGQQPGYIVGANMPDYGSAAAGTSDLFVIEADEYDHMFLGLNPTVAVVTNVEWDHPDYYPTPAAFRRAFRQFVDRVHRRGLIITCRDDAGAEQLRDYAYSRGPAWITYGLDPAAGLQALDVAGHSRRRLHRRGASMGDARGDAHIARAGPPQRSQCAGRGRCRRRVRCTAGRGAGTPGKLSRRGAAI